MPIEVSASDLFKTYNWGDPILLQRTDLGNRSGKIQLQDYNALKQQHSASGTNFTDSNFPHDDSSIGSIYELFDVAKDPNFFTSQVSQGWDQGVQWIRIKDYMTKGTAMDDRNLVVLSGSETPVFGTGNKNDTISRMDINQGMVGDCWFLAALGAVSLRPDLLDNCIPCDNVYNEEGIYHFKFWYQGCWIDIVIDDYIPVMEYNTPNGNNYYRSLASNPSRCGNNELEFWVILTEKACAKLFGSFRNIAGNSPSQGFENLTGGFPEEYPLNGNPPSDLLSTCKNCLNKNVFLALSCYTNDQGLVSGHAYSITGFATVHMGGPYGGRAVDLLRIRNPWGRTEWTGAFNDNDGNWQYVAPSERSLCVKANDGEFWMQYNDVVEKFAVINAITLLKPEDFPTPSVFIELVGYFGEWKRSDNTAGGPNKPENNPQFIVELKGQSAPGAKQALGVAITIQGSSQDKTSPRPFFRVFRIPDGVTKNPPFAYGDFYLDYGDGKAIIPHEQVDIYGSRGSLQGRLFLARGYTLDPGRYLVIPTTNNPGEEAKYCLRILSQV